VIVQGEVMVDVEATKHAECKRMYIRIISEVSAIICEWQWFKSVYFDNSRAIQWHQQVPRAYGILARALQRDMTTMLVRLMDKPTESLRKKCISIPQLLFDLYGKQSEFPKDVEALVKNLKTKCEIFIPHRHTQVAHLDFAIAENGPSFEVPRLSGVDDVIANVQALLTVIAAGNGWPSFDLEIEDNAMSIEREWSGFMGRLQEINAD
jgi:HEPN superfamily AbiU2-like protein